MDLICISRRPKVSEPEEALAAPLAMHGVSSFTLIFTSARGRGRAPNPPELAPLSPFALCCVDLGFPATVPTRGSGYPPFPLVL